MTQPWYADDSIALSNFARFKECFHLLEQHSPGQGYYLEPSKIVLIVHTNNLKDRKLFGLCRGFKLYMGARYLGGYIRDDESKPECLKEHT